MTTLAKPNKLLSFGQPRARHLLILQWMLLTDWSVRTVKIKVWRHTVARHLYNSFDTRHRELKVKGHSTETGPWRHWNHNSGALTSSLLLPSAFPLSLAISVRVVPQLQLLTGSSLGRVIWEWTVWSTKGCSHFLTLIWLTAGEERKKQTKCRSSPVLFWCPVLGRNKHCPGKQRSSSKNR